MSIQQRRLDKGWSQEDLADFAGISTRTIQRLETGKRASLETLKCLAAVFETSVSDLVKDQTMTHAHPTSPAQSHFIEQAEKDAIAYVQNLRAFHLNWITSLVVLPFLYLLNRALSPEFWWVMIVGAAWAMAILLHALVIFGMFSLFGAEWEQEELKKRMKTFN